MYATESQLTPPGDLVPRIRAGHAGAADQLAREHWPRLFRLARSIVRCEQDAQDAAQDALVSALRHIDRLEDPAALEPWLNRIVTNAALSRLRRRKAKRERPIESLLPAFHDDGHRVDPKGDWTVTAGARLDSEDMRALLRDAIDELPAQYREVIMLRDINGLDTASTAAVLGIEESNAKVRLHRARQALRTLIEESMEAR